MYFLDIDMPTYSGLELRKKLMDIPVCVFITSHPEHAVESFELETLDFIVKPLRKSDLHKPLLGLENLWKSNTKPTCTKRVLATISSTSKTVTKKSRSNYTIFYMLKP